MRLMAVSHVFVEPAYRAKWYALRELAPDLDTLVITPREWHEPEFGRKFSPPESMERLQFVPLSASSNRFSTRYVFVGPGLPTLMRQFRPDVIHVEGAEPWSASYMQIVLLRRLLASQARLSVRSVWNTQAWRTPLRFPASLTHKAALRATNLLLPGNHGADLLYRQHGYAGPMAIVPHIGVSPAVYHPSPPEGELMERLGLVGQFVIGFAGRLTRRKGVGTLLEAAARLGEAPWKLLLVGTGSDQDEFVRQARALGIGERVVFAGTVLTEQVPRFMHTMNVLVLPSTKELWEDFGRVLIEAMACGVPVLGSTSGEIPHVIDNPEQVFPMGDAATLAGQLRRLMDAPDFAAACRAHGLRRVREHYTDQAVARQLYAALRAAAPTAGPA